MKKLKLDLSQNNVICGDCKDWLHYIPDNKIDLIYIDPPFFSNRNYEIIWGNGFELRSYGDRWKGGIEHYISWMRERLVIAHKKLSPTGSFFLHCDWHASHRLRVLLDDVFGEQNFRNEIIHCYTKPSGAKANLPRNHQTIYFYSKSEKYTFNQPRMKHKSGVHNNGQIHKQKNQRDYDIKKSLEEKGKKIESWWIDIWSCDRYRKELIGYKTQKPEALIKRILEMSSKKNDIVLDFFGGGGTTAKVAYELDRRFIIGDISPVAVRVIKEERLKKQAGCHNFIDCNPYLTKEEWRLVKGHDFANKVCEYMSWIVNPKKSGDGGIDGWANDTKTIPVQIKNSDVNVPTIRDLAGVCNAQYKSGIVVGWSFSKGCYEFVSSLERKSKIKIELKEADTIVQPIKSLDKARWQKLYAERVKEAKRFKSQSKLKAV